MHGCRGAGALQEEEERKGREREIDKSVKQKKSAVVKGKSGEMRKVEREGQRKKRGP